MGAILQRASFVVETFSLAINVSVGDVKAVHGGLTKL